MALPLRVQTATAERRRRAFLSRDEIVGAAAGILERDGYDALTMRAVAAELGVQAAALYRHIAGRDELNDLLFDHLMADCAPDIVGRDWREDLRSIAAAWRARLIGRRDATRIALSLVSVGPNVALDDGAAPRRAPPLGPWRRRRDDGLRRLPAVRAQPRQLRGGLPRARLPSRGAAAPHADEPGVGERLPHHRRAGRPPVRQSPISTPSSPSAWGALTAAIERRAGGG